MKGYGTAHSPIRYAQPSISPLEVRYVTDAIANGWGDQCYDYITRFEAAFRAHLGSSHAIATSSATGALQLGLKALGVSKGDEIIVGDINWIASVAPAVHLGATPVFVDVLRNTWCLDPEAVKNAITPRTKAIIAVHLYGNLCDMDALEAIADHHGIALVEDAAEAIGSTWSGVRAGTRGAFGVFSFHGTKTITTGEGGMFVTNDAALYERCLTLSNHGRARTEQRQFWPSEVGFKYKMSNIQAALGCAQLERIEDLVAGKRRVFEYYRAGLEGLPLTMNPEPPNTRNGFWMPTIVAQTPAFNRDSLLRTFSERNIDARVFFWPLTLTPPFSRAAQHPVSYFLYRNAINLPSYHDLTEVEMNRVIEVVRAGFG